MRFSLVLLLILASAALHAASLSVDGQIQQSGITKAVIRAQLPEIPGQKITLGISGKINTLRAIDRSGLELEVDVRQEGNGTIVSVVVPYDYAEIEIQSDDFTSKSGADWQFYLSLRPNMNADSFDAIIRLPEGAVAKSSNGAVAPSGNSVSIVWEGKNITPQAGISMRAGYSIAAGGEENGNAFFIAILAFVGALGAYSFVKMRKPEENEKARPVKKNIRKERKEAQKLEERKGRLEESPLFKTLDETDKEIVREIALAGGKTTQARIYANTHIPKATLSRRLASLENRGMVRRSDKGNMKLVSLSDGVLAGEKK